MEPESPRRAAISRRTFLAGAAGAGIGVAAGAAAIATAHEIGPFASAVASAPAVVPFWGEHQAGIATPAQDRLEFGAFDVTTDRRADLADLFAAWTDAAARMCAGDAARELNGDPAPPPADSGEADGLTAARLTITFGLGPTLFQRGGVDRFGLRHRQPAALAELPAFATDALNPARSGGDLCVQACADDPVVAFHAVRNLARIASGAAVLRWSQAGFGRTSSTSREQTTPRNLMGFKDGTNNIRAEDAALLGEHVWAGDEGPDWMRGGSYAVTRRIRIRIEAWDRDSLGDQERRVGRTKVTGAPLGGTKESDAVDLAAMSGGRSVIPENAHIRVASPAENGGIRILRRGYSFSDGLTTAGELDAGLFFICYQRDPRAQFVALQQRLAASDALNLYLVHTGSAVFACPRGAQRGASIAQALFGE